jgi:hypothetical protein
MTRQLALFFIVGPLRTGSSLLSRCIDDHPGAICLCESEINRTLFPPFALRLHHERMRNHGLSTDEILRLLDRKPPNSVEAWLDWYAEAAGLLQQRLEKPGAIMLGDKSPDFFTAPKLLETIALRAPLIYTVRDPRAILRSIWRQTDADEPLKEERWELFRCNLRAWRPHWKRSNLLVSRYEDLVREPVDAMRRIHAHLGLPPSSRFLEPFERRFPSRFLWETAVDWESGIRRDFDPSRAIVSDDDLTDAQRKRIWGDEVVRSFMTEFGYA